MGAAGTYHAALQSVHVKFVVTMGCYANHQQILRRDWIKYGVSGLILQMIMNLLRKNFPNDEEIQPNRMISRISENVPILIIHGTLDGGAPFGDAIELRDLVKARVSKFVTSSLLVRSKL
jgi:dipeptidyl aminopeptidase/acylaminoacyl peptidase